MLPKNIDPTATHTFVGIWRRFIAGATERTPNILSVK